MRDLATRSEVDVSVISRAERGIGSLPRVSTIRKLAEGLQLSADEREELLLLAGHTTPVDSAGMSLLQRIGELEERMDVMQARLDTLENR